VRLIGIDIETTGFSCDNDFIVEIGAVGIMAPGLQQIHVFECLINPKGEYKLPEKNGVPICPGLSPEIIASEGIPIANAIEQLQVFIDYYNPDYLVSHNSAFERRFLDASGFDTSRYNWIDTMLQCPERPGIKEKWPKLSELCLRNGVDPVEPLHRAVSDVKSMLACLIAYGVDKALAL
jgi:DNA polymerase-3 subunit alpha (Gram-positive type)